ncbi:MAG TPA: hypothetical protein VMX17_10065 [Candidatus Glassbacteria bacterium]|nr:hypothetical protein [Candidatus Glassbacteria bacterium]
MDITDFKNINIKTLLNKYIWEVLYGGPTDPGYAELEAATAMYLVLKKLELKVKDEKDLLKTLRGQNVFDEDFLESFIKVKK